MKRLGWRLATAVVPVLFGMMKNWKSLLVVLFVLCVGVLVPVTVNSYNNNQEPPQWLTVMKAEQGKFQESTGGDYTLTLTGVKPEMLAFTNRPDRQAQRWDTTEFLDNWAGQFDNDPPNAVISAGGESAITINDPKISGDTVTFTASPLPGQTLPTDTINQPTLFIDGVTIGPCYYVEECVDGVPIIVPV
jgi:hypothetical protein